MVATTIGERIDEEIAEVQGRRKERAARMHADGVPQVDIMRLLGINERTYFAWFPEERAEDQSTEHRLIAMRRLRELGWSNGAIGRKFGMSRQRVNVLLGPIENVEGSAVPAAYTWRTIPGRLERVQRHAEDLGAIDENDEASIGVLLSMIASGRVSLTLAVHEREERDLAG